jgi:hypothetical protein
MRRHASSYFPVHPRKNLAQFAPDDQGVVCLPTETLRPPGKSRVTMHVNEPTIVVFPAPLHVSLEGVDELAMLLRLLAVVPSGR